MTKKEPKENFLLSKSTIWIIKVVLWFIVGIFSLYIFSTLVSPNNSIQNDENKQQIKENFLSENLEELYHKYYNSSLTDLQKEYVWDNEYKDKQVRWQAYVKNIEKRGLLTENDLMGTISQGNIKSQVGVKFKDSELSKLLSYPVGSLIKFDGRLASEGTIIGSKIFYIREAVIVE